VGDELPDAHADATTPGPGEGTLAPMRRWHRGAAARTASPRGRVGVTLVLRIIWGAFVVGFTGAALFAMANGEWLAFCILGLAATGSLRQLLAYLPTDDGDDR